MTLREASQRVKQHGYTIYKEIKVDDVTEDNLKEAILTLNKHGYSVNKEFDLSHLQEMSQLATDTMVKFLDDFYYSITHVINFRKEKEAFDPKNFHVESMIKEVYENSCGEEFLELVNPPEENEWLEQVIIGLKEKSSEVSDYHKNSYLGFINYIEKENLLKIVLDEVKQEHQNF